MSFLLFQQNLPFQTMRQYLRYWQPSSTITPEVWATRHAQNLRSGDVLFFLDPIYSPWGDSTSGIGVSEGDSFKVAQACLILKGEGGQLMAINVSGDRYDTQPLEQFLAVQAAIAKSNGGGFYYAVGRRQQDIDDTIDVRLAEMMARYGGSGSRSTNQLNLPDPVMTFLTTLGMQMDPGFTEAVLDPGQLAFLLFSDKEPPAGTKLPDMREVFVALEGTNERSAGAQETGEAATAAKTNTGERAALYMDLEEKEDDQEATMDAMPMLAKFQKRNPGVDAKDALLGAIVEAAEASALNNKTPDPGAPGEAITTSQPKPQIKIPMPQIPSMPVPQAPQPQPAAEAPAAPAVPAPPAVAGGGGGGRPGILASLGPRTLPPAGGAQPSVPPVPDFEGGMDSAESMPTPPAPAPTTSATSELPVPPAAPPPPVEAPAPPPVPSTRPGRLAIKIPVPPSKQPADAGATPAAPVTPPAETAETAPQAAPAPVDTPSSQPAAAAEAGASGGGPSPWDTPGGDAAPDGGGPTGFSKLLGSLTQQPPKFAGMDSLAKLGGGGPAPPPVPQDIFGGEPEPAAPSTIPPAATAPPAADNTATAASASESPAAPPAIDFMGSGLPPAPPADAGMPALPVSEFTTEIQKPHIEPPSVVRPVEVKGAGSDPDAPPSPPQVKISVPKIDPILATFGAEPEEPEPPREVPEPVRIEPPSSIAAVPPRKKRAEGPLGESRISALKDPLNVKSGVAGLVSKLEQQATKASAKLEEQLEEISESLNSEFSSAVEKVRESEKASIEKTNELRTYLTERLQQAMNDVRVDIGQKAVVGRDAIERFVEEGEEAVDEKNKSLTESLNESFEEVRVRAEVLARSFQETSDAQRAKAMADLRQLMESLLNQFTEANEYYSFALDGIIEHVNEQVQDRSKSTAESLRDNYEHLDNQLGQVYDRARKQLDHINQDVLSRLGQSIQAAELDFVTARLDAVQTQLTPQLRTHRDTLRALISEFQSKLISDLETKAAQIIEEFAPILDDKKQQISDVIVQTSKIRESVEERQRFDADRCDMDFRAFVEDTIEDAKAKFQRTEEQISEMDRSVRVLCDPANIEGDADLLNERESVLERMDAKTSEAAQEIHESLNASVASLEERAKQLQEELISRLEEDAYLVRKSSEQALIRINTAIKDAFTSIQIAQDEQME
jgi:hypothetical protein